MGLAGYENTDAVAYLPYGEASLEETDAMDRQLTQPAWLHEQLQNLQLDKTVVLMDTPSWPSTLARQALRVAHLVVVCLPASTRSCKAQPLVRHLLSQTTAAQAVVITDFDPRRKLQLQSLEWLREQWADILIPYVIHRDESVPAALNQMSCVCAQTPTAQSAHDMQGIASWIAKRCGVEAGGL
jgi:cellulose synthase operon protein YhjQ